MTPEEANPIALRAVRRVLAAAHPFELEVVGTRVSVEIAGQEAVGWPKPIPGLDPETHGPWPPRVSVRCIWDGGSAEFAAVALAGRDAKAPVVISARLYPTKSYLGFSNVSKALVASDEPEVPVPAWFHLKKRTARSLQSARNKKLRELVSDSGLPMQSDWAVQLMTVRAEDGSVRPDEATIFERLIHINLIKLDFFSGGKRGRRRGKPLVDLAALGLGDDSAELDEPVEEDEDERRYWAGGFGEPARLARFIEERAWENDWKRDADTKGARQSWKQFDQISVGDWFAIKGFGGDYQLSVHFLGEVRAIDRDRGRLELTPLSHIEPYKGPAPRGSGAGSWFDTLVPVTRDDIVELLFGVGGERTRALEWAGPRNVILYGPPGTGKTYQLRTNYFPKFTRKSERQPLDIDAINELSWFEVIAASMIALGGEATPMALRDHPFVLAKSQARPTKTPVLARIWGTLQGHTLRESTTVRYAARSGRLVFDKREDGRWFFPEGAPEDLVDLAEGLEPKPATVSEDYVFLTFHQSYAYEDFIEGIRPKVDEGDDEEVASLRYVLEDGVFLRAANAAVKLAGFTGTIDTLCRLPREKRTELFEGAPPYGVFVDEINRGNASRIFGELITLLEEDKRLGAEGELVVTLPYSRRRFGVPPNVCLIGTMNTADRSVEALDAALRRRFSFIECGPDPDPLQATLVEGVDLTRLMRAINDRLEVLLDRDHRIGHAHFMPVVDDPTIAKLKEVFAMSIIPLLTEYFYADIGRVGLVLGDAFVRRVNTQTALAAFDHEAAGPLSERATYRIAPIDGLTNNDFRSVYETTS